MFSTANDRSAQPCGCDPGCGEGYLCERHRMTELGEALPSTPLSVGAPTRPTSLPKDAKGRKSCPVYSGVLQYFPDAIVAVANVSYVGNEQHNPGQPLHWDRSKSTDEHDACLRHLMEAGTVDSDGVRHTAKAAWRALAALQKEIESDNAL